MSVDQALAITWVGANWGPVFLRAAVLGLFFSFVSSSSSVQREWLKLIFGMFRKYRVIVLVLQAPGHILARQLLAFSWDIHLL